MNEQINETITNEEINAILNAEERTPKDKEIYDYFHDIHNYIMSKSLKDIEFVRPILTMDNIPLLYPNSLTVLQGLKGVHKSRLGETIAASFLSNSSQSMIGLEVDSSKEYFLVFVDTERNYEDQLPYAIQHLKRVAGYGMKEVPANIEIVSLVNEPRESRIDAVRSIIEGLRITHSDKHLVVIIDVITDLVGNFNSVCDTMSLADILNDIINRNNCSIICVIHQNPVVNSEKARGHLGTEFVNKASVVLQIAKDKEGSIYIKFLHIRADRLPKEKYYLEYDEEGKRLRMADRALKTPILSEQELFEEALTDVLPPGTELMQKELVELLKAKLGKGDGAIRNRLSNHEGKEIDEFYLRVRRDGMTKYYSLVIDDVDDDL